MSVPVQPQKIALETPAKATKSETARKKREALQKALPERISVFGRELNVVVMNLRGLHGDCDVDKNQIRIHQNLTIEAARSTLFHEALHAALELSGHCQTMKEEQEEALVRMLEHAFAHIVDVDKLAPVRKDLTNS